MSSSANPQTLVKELRTVDEPSDLTPIIDTGAQLFERLARDPNLDPDKLERLMGLWERLEERQAEAAFNVAMSAAQQELRPVSADAENSQTHSRYASYTALDAVCRPIYTKHGFALSYDTAESPVVDHLRILCYATHGKYKRTYRVDMPTDGKGAKGGDVMTKTHATGAAMSYGQRYLLKLIFNIAVGEDRDGNAPKSARKPEPVEPTELGKWWAHVQRVAGKGGFPALEAAWETTDPAIKNFMVKYRKADWEALKVDALKVKSK